MQRTLSLLISLALTPISSSAGAQAPSIATPAASASKTSTSDGAKTLDAETRLRRAESHFERGVDFYEERNYDGALAEFSRAHELVPNYRVLYNLAQTQAERHEYVDAIRLFGEYLEQGGEEIPAARREATERERESLLQRVATVQIESNVGGAELWVDGRSRGVVPSRHSLRVNAGMADVRLEKPGYEPVSRQLTIAGGDSVVVRVRLAPRAVDAVVRPSAAASVARREAEGGPNTALWLGLGATALLTGATATFAVLAAREDSELDRELREYQETPARLDATRSRLRTHAALADGFGAAMIVGLGATLFVAITGAEEDASPADRADRVRVLVGSSGLSLRRDF